jgi:heme/copper-type cytochrome/quinol oxidase subunit 4
MDSETTSDVLAIQRKTLIKWVIILFIVNVILTLVDPYSTSKDITGETVSGWEVKRSVLSTLTIGFVIISLILSSLLTLIPYKNLKYGQKYFYFALIIFFALQCLFCLLEAKNLWFAFKPQ